jgi:hypothetical protein
MTYLAELAPIEISELVEECIIHVLHEARFHVEQCVWSEER